MKIVDQIKLDQKYQSLKFKMTPFSTFVGNGEETLIMTFMRPEKIITSGTNPASLSNIRTSITIEERSDSVPRDTETASITLGYVMGFGTFASFIVTTMLKVFFG